MNERMPTPAQPILAPARVLSRPPAPTSSPPMSPREGGDLLDTGHDFSRVTRYADDRAAVLEIA
jgi:hypothetical protein